MDSDTVLLGKLLLRAAESVPPTLHLVNSLWEKVVNPRRGDESHKIREAISKCQNRNFITRLNLRLSSAPESSVSFRSPISEIQTKKTTTTTKI